MYLLSPSPSKDVCMYIDQVLLLLGESQFDGLIYGLSCPSSKQAARERAPKRQSGRCSCRDRIIIGWLPSCSRSHHLLTCDISSFAFHMQNKRQKQKKVAILVSRQTSPMYPVICTTYIHIRIQIRCMYVCMYVPTVLSGQIPIRAQARPTHPDPGGRVTSDKMERTHGSPRSLQLPFSTGSIGFAWCHLPTCCWRRERGGKSRQLGGTCLLQRFALALSVHPLLCVYR